jgi:CubicO group peptidase (beta-lactamase class C family)
MADAYSQEHNSLVLVIYEGDAVVYENYQYDYGPHVARALYSGTKSFWCGLAAAAVQDGLLDLDERVADTITEFDDDPLKSQITVRHLLSLTSGMDPGERLWAAVGEDRFRAALHIDMIAAPGERFTYGPSHLYVFGELMRRKLQPQGESLLDYLFRRILDPIGLEVTAWPRDIMGDPYMDTGAMLAAPQWAKYGMLIRDGGAWDGEQLLPAEVLEACFIGTEANPAYGLSFWLNVYVPDELISGEVMEQDVFPGDRNQLYEAGPPDLVASIGAFNQRMYIIPSLDLVVVRFGYEDPTWDDAEFLARLLDGRPAN